MVTFYALPHIYSHKMSGCGHRCAQNKKKFKNKQNEWHQCLGFFRLIFTFETTQVQLCQINPTSSRLSNKLSNFQIDWPFSNGVSRPIFPPSNDSPWPV